MTRKLLNVLLAGMVCLLTAWPAAAWGPKADRALVDMAVRIVTKETGIPLTNLRKDIQRGASISTTELLEFVPAADADPKGAIESEMYLLQAVRGQRIDPYFAFRLGVVGKLVAGLTSPLANAEPTYRSLYFTDVDANVDRIQVTKEPRHVVDPDVYLPAIERAASAREDVILQDYKTGLGFRGVASQSLPEDASRTMNSIADVLHTALSRRGVVADVPAPSLRAYYLNALKFYIERGNRTETEAAYNHLVQEIGRNADLLKEVADMFFDAEEYERAVKEYQRVQAMAPERRDVVERIAEYYVRTGDNALRAEKLEEALAAFQSAREADPLNEEAQSKFLKAQALLDKRQGRLAATRTSMSSAKELEERADQAIRNNDYGEAIEHLFAAREMYLAIGAEFQKESVEARSGANRVTDRLSRIREDLTRNAGRLSGSSSAGRLRTMASDTSKQLAGYVLKQAASKQYEDSVRQLREDLRDEIQLGSE